MHLDGSGTNMSLCSGDKKRNNWDQQNRPELNNTRGLHCGNNKYGGAFTLKHLWFIPRTYVQSTFLCHHNNFLCYQVNYNVITEFLLRTLLGFYKNKVLKEMLLPKSEKVTEEWRKMHNKNFCNFYSSPNIARMIQ